MDAAFALLVALDPFLGDPCLLEVVAVHEYVPIVGVHYDEPIVFGLIEELEFARVSLIFLDLEGAHVAGRHGVLPPGG